ncbi:MAG: DUF255 domain-containing protein, partial [Pyrinomonadaceae bacterium]
MVDRLDIQRLLNLREHPKSSTPSPIPPSPLRRYNDVLIYSPEKRVTEAKPTNRLIHETSPYLVQHAHNPVDWYAWGE